MREKPHLLAYISAYDILMVFARRRWVVFIRQVRVEKFLTSWMFRLARSKGYCRFQTRPNNSQQDTSTYCYVVIPPEMNSYFLRSKVTKAVTRRVTVACRVTEEWRAIDQTHWFSLTRRDVLDANAVIQRWSMSTDIFLGYTIDLFEPARENLVSAGITSLNESLMFLQ